MSTPHFQGNSGFISLFDHLLQLPSVSSGNISLDQSNLPVINLLAEVFEQLGFTCEIIRLEENPDKANLIATYGKGPGGLVLSGHTDTVPFDAQLWQNNPLKLTEKENRFYGLGSTDMKGFFAVVYAALEPLLKQSSDFRQPLIILATADEESSMDGARALARMGRPKARYAVIGEPTSLQPINMHKSVMMETIRIQGKSGHSSNPALGNNALEAMHEVIAELLKFRRHLQAEHQNPHFAVDVPTMNLGAIHGGDNPNRICGHCKLEFDLRLLPGMANDSIRDAIQAMISPLAEKYHTEIKLESLFPGVEAFENPHSELVKVAEKLSGYKAVTAAFGTEAPFLQELGMDTIVLGPGSIDMAHQPDEYMEASQVKPAIELIQALIRKYCF
ncbi:MAG: acetylornithine deacetylase [Gammaproteobacteria bacterium]|nr:acetylornithine deacetylase [Gammaproteobacteria bacterium]|tara:strand:- start:29983 stop:31149 length:1167 start_codon:yes stop_codon:yes gene_type:complete